MPIETDSIEDGSPALPAAEPSQVDPAAAAQHALDTLEAEEFRAQVHLHSHVSRSTYAASQQRLYVLIAPQFYVPLPSFHRISGP